MRGPEYFVSVELRLRWPMGLNLSRVRQQTEDGDSALVSVLFVLGPIEVMVMAARGYGRGRALDCFTFHGGFALHLARRSERVLAIDVSGAAIAQARRNAELNRAGNIEFMEANVFDLLREMETAGERFDVINLDPPAFAKNRASVEAAARGYKEINLRAMKLLSPGGTLITSTCSYHMGEDSFLNVLADAAALQPGEILVTPITDIGWTPYFSLIAGLVTDLGSAVSHGAVIAREYGLPCVVNTREGTRFLKTGDRVRLDGDKGTVERL